jgi:hypothetical protein
MPHSEDETIVAPHRHEGMRKPNLTSQQRRDNVQALLLMYVPGDVELKLSFHVDQKTIRRKFWQLALANFNNPDIESFISLPKKKGNTCCFFVCLLSFCIIACFKEHRMNIYYAIQHHIKTFGFDWLCRDRQPLRNFEIIPISAGNY